MSAESSHDIPPYKSICDDIRGIKESLVAMALAAGWIAVIAAAVVMGSAPATAQVAAQAGLGELLTDLGAAVGDFGATGEVVLVHGTEPVPLR